MNPPTHAHPHTLSDQYAPLRPNTLHSPPRLLVSLGTLHLNSVHPTGAPTPVCARTYTADTPSFVTGGFVAAVGTLIVTVMEGVSRTSQFEVLACEEPRVSVCVKDELPWLRVLLHPTNYYPLYLFLIRTLTSHQLYCGPAEGNPFSF